VWSRLPVARTFPSGEDATEITCARVGVPGYLGLGDELTGGRDTLRILRVALLDDRETGSSQREDEQHRQECDTRSHAVSGHAEGRASR
jgi:hypothetical protein